MITNLKDVKRATANKRKQDRRHDRRRGKGNTEERRPAMKVEAQPERKDDAEDNVGLFARDLADVVREADSRAAGNISAAGIKESDDAVWDGWETATALTINDIVGTTNWDDIDTNRTISILSPSDKHQNANLNETAPVEVKEPAAVVESCDKPQINNNNNGSGSNDDDRDAEEELDALLDM